MAMLSLRWGTLCNKFYCPTASTMPILCRRLPISSSGSPSAIMQSTGLIHVLDSVAEAGALARLVNAIDELVQRLKVVSH